MFWWLRKRFDFNAAIDAYCMPGYGIDRLERYCRRCRYSGSVETLANRINEIREAIYEIVRQKSPSNGLRTEEIGYIAQEYVDANEPEITAVGVKSLTNYLTWICWHDGWLRG
jgi:hypothetical protein